MFVVDTDILTLLEHGQQQVTAHLRTVEREVVTTIITRIEILQGRMAGVVKAEHGAQLLLAQQRLEQSESQLQRIRVLRIDEGAAEWFDRLHKDKKLKKIGRADLLIASITLAHRAVLVTRNLRHFQQIPGLQLENWAG